MTELQFELEKEAKALGATHFGIANLLLAKDGPITRYEKRLISRFPLAISIGVKLSGAVVDLIENQSDIIALQNYQYHFHDAVNPLIDRVTLKISHILIENGYPAFQVPSSQVVDWHNLQGIFSNKLAASLAGLGWIGKSCLLITPDSGPRVRWGTVLTNAALSCGKPMQGNSCGKCNLCVEACPAGAFTGKPFHPSEPRTERMDAVKCYSLQFEQRKKTTGVHTCGLCVCICPYGRKSSRSGRAVEL